MKEILKVVTTYGAKFLAGYFNLKVTNSQTDILHSVIELLSNSLTLGSMTEYWVTTALSLATWIEGFIKIFMVSKNVYKLSLKVSFIDNLFT